MKLALVSQRVSVDAASDERRDALDQRWSTFLHECGLTALAVPALTRNAEHLCRLLPVRLIVLSGGNDLADYGGDAPERDALETALIEAGLHLRIPVLGVCRGMQMLQYFFGGALAAVNGHVRTRHALDDGRTVNSFHTWGVHNAAPGLQAIAHAPDGTIEAVRGQDTRMLGTMWHPEREHPFDARDIAMIRELVETKCVR